MQALHRSCEHVLRRLTRPSDSGIMCPNRLGCQCRSPVLLRSMCVGGVFLLSVS